VSNQLLEVIMTTISSSSTARPLSWRTPAVVIACGCAMVIVLHEARDKGSDFSTFRCEECSRSERFVCEE